MTCQSNTLRFGKIFGVFDYANLFSLVPGGLKTERVTASSSPASSIYNLLLG